MRPGNREHEEKSQFPERRVVEREGGEFRGGLWWWCLRDTQAQPLPMPPLPESSEDVTGVCLL